MSAAQPGSILLATVLMPEDSYPNSTFVGASLQLALDPSLTPETCKEFLILRAPGPSATLRATTIQGEPFHWTEEITATDSTQFYERDYAGFPNGMCYELYLRVAVASATNYDGWKKQADGEKILRHLEKIISTLQIHPKPLASARQEVPVIKAFTVTSLPHPVLQNIYRISWNVSGARENQVFVSVDCLDGIGTYQLPNGLTDLDSSKSSFPCGVFAPSHPMPAPLTFNSTITPRRDFRKGLPCSSQASISQREPLPSNLTILTRSAARNLQESDSPLSSGRSSILNRLPKGRPATLAHNSALPRSILPDIGV